MTIDRLLPESWTPETLAALERWRQGHLIEMDRGAWIVPAWVDDPVTGEPSAGGAVGEVRARSAPLSDTGYAVVVSQTCDIAGGPARRHPLVQVCPVRDISEFSPEKIQQVKDRLVSEYVWLSKPPVEGAMWAVDLRAMVSVSKGLLAAVEPIEGFASIEDELILGQRLASKLARPAVHDALAGPVFDALRKFIAKAKKSQVWCDDVEQLRLEVVEGTALYPKRVRLLVLTDHKFGPSERKPLREEWKAHRKALKDAGITWEAIHFVTVDHCSVRLYRGTIPIEVLTLERGRFV
ncbi:hypothetical protein [Mycolicibacterium austroafricanum]|uniref:hypothetical protein n=1 Tax=Mycolicibacterium austroafricanum TaxID=39687 RepID=UPI001CA3558A|nr:hypothetical protein [Mycolicibacterium austroafricanum]QZT56229.1 hypothetical protein JN084_25440 [Mycolicibacterium austroafricanum]